MGALKRSNRAANRAGSAPPAEDIDGPRSGIRAKRARSTPPRARASSVPREAATRREGAAPRSRKKGSQKTTSTRNDEFAFLAPDISALDWGDAAESFAEEFIASATGAEAVNEAARDEVIVEEVGGPFIDVPTESLPFGAVDWFGEEEPLG